MDRWPSGHPVERVVYFGFSFEGVSWRMPPKFESSLGPGYQVGERVFTTLTRYNKSFPELWKKCREGWRNVHDRSKRERVGLVGTPGAD